MVTQLVTDIDTGRITADFLMSTHVVKASSGVRAHDRI
jgi:hypothetical protein